jgi:hypothetical protein
LFALEQEMMMQKPGLESLKRLVWSHADNKGQLIFWASIYLLLTCLLHFVIIAAPVDADSAYHVAVGRLISRYGILHSFPWTPFSWLSGHYADKELLFHLLFVPLAGINWVLAAKIVGALTGTALLLTIYSVLRKEGVRFAGLWALFPLVASDVFLWRFALVRPHLISITLAFIVVWAATNHRLVILAIASAIYPWAYVGWQLPVILSCISEIAGFVSSRPFRWKVVVTALVGTAAGLALHPNTMNLLHFTWIQIVDVLFQRAWGERQNLELGREFAPFTFGQWARWLIVCVAMMVSSVILAWRKRRNDSTSLAFALVTLVFFGITLKTARFAEYFIPFSVVSFALATRAISWKYLPVGVFIATVLYTSFPLAETIRGLGTSEDRISPPVMQKLQRLIPPGSQVFTTEWGFTGMLMLALPDRKFIVALDPTFFLVKDPELYRIWYDLPRHPHPGIAEIIRQRFGARYVISFFDDRFTDFYFQLSSEPGVRALLLSNESWIVFDLGGSGMPGT